MFRPVTLLRTVATYAIGLLATAIAAASVLVVAQFAPTHPLIDRIARAWSRSMLALAGVRLSVDGSENVFPDTSYVVVANHLSNLDVMACFLAVPLPIRFLAKKELFSVPLFASAIRSIGMIEVDRQAPTPVHDQINRQTRDLVETGRSIIIYPEGTRSLTGELAPFKKGAFTIAVATGLPILPITIVGSHQAWAPSSPWVRGGPVHVTVSRPLPTADLTQADTTALRDETWRIISTQQLATRSLQS